MHNSSTANEWKKRALVSGESGESVREREGAEETEVGKKYNKMAMRTRRDALADKS